MHAPLELLFEIAFPFSLSGKNFKRNFALISVIWLIFPNRHNVDNWSPVIICQVTFKYHEVSLRPSVTFAGVIKYHEKSVNRTFSMKKSFMEVWSHVNHSLVAEGSHQISNRFHKSVNLPNKIYFISFSHFDISTLTFV